MTKPLATVLLVAAAFGVAPGTRAQDAVLEAFVGCTSPPLEELVRQRDELGRISSSPLAKESEKVRRSGTELRFERPLRSLGLDLRGYRQETTTFKQDEIWGWRWGFVIAAKPRQVAFALDRRIKRPGLSQYGFFKEGERWRAGLGGEKTSQWRQLIVAPLDDGTSLLTCELSKSYYDGFAGLPDVSKLADPPD